MHVITTKRLREFWADHPEAEAPLRAWIKIAEHAAWQNHNEVKATVANSADRYKSRTIFDIGGNKFRLIVKIEDRHGKIFIKEILTHDEYSTGQWKSRC